MRLFKEIFASEPQYSHVEDMFPIAMVTPEGHTITKDGKHAIVLELSGQDYSGMDPDRMHTLYLGRKRFFDFLPTELTVLSHSHRIKMSNYLDADANSETFSNAMSRRIARRWSRNFQETCRSKHYLIFLTQSDNFKDQLMMLTEKKSKSGVPLRMHNMLETAVQEALSRLSVYKPSVLSGDELVSYWAWMLNGQPVYRKCPTSGFLDGLMAETMLIWPEGEPYQVYKGRRERYSGWLHVLAPPSDTRSKMLDELFASRREFSLFQTFSRFPKELALNEAEDRLKNAAMFEKAGSLLVATQQELMDRLSDDQVTLMRHRWSLEVFAESLAELEDAITEVRGIIGSYGLGLAREVVNQEASFWSRFPSQQNLQTRVRYMTSENAAQFATFATSNEGLDRSTWGNKPVTMFKTRANTDYALSWHLDERPASLGNAMFIGGSGSGKTTAINFLIAMCYKFRNFRAVMFDRLNGMEVFTNAMSGVYVGTRALSALEMNPLQLDYTSENKTFWSGWFQALTGRDSDEDKEAIGRAIEQLGTLAKEHRNLSELAPAFGLPEKDTLARALQQWLPNGNQGHFFNGARDALSFDNPLVTFDMTSYLDDPEVLAPLTLYIFHQLLLSGRKDGGFAVVVDELPKYLQNKAFMPKIESILQEIRKQNGVFIGACQDAATLLNHPSAAKFKANVAKFFLAPEPKAEERHYIGELELNANEFNWIKNTDPSSRMWLIKSRGGGSVIVNGDLSPLGKDRGIFNSDASAVARMYALKHEHGSEWLHFFLQDDQLAA